jgi:glucose uptake protein
MRIGQTRQKVGISVGDGGNEALVRRMRAQANFIENTPLTLILLGAIALTIPSRDPILTDRRSTGQQVGAGVLFGIGNLALLAVVARIGTGAGFTIAQLSLAVNASIGIWIFRRPPPGTRQARRVLVGIAIAGVGGCVIAALR